MVAEAPSGRVTIALIGAKGMLASMIRERAPQNCFLHLFDLPEFDLTRRSQVMAELQSLAPDVIINCAAFTNVDGAETDQTAAMSVNGEAVGYLAEAACAVDAVLVHISTDYVFDGQSSEPYVETDATNPQSVYGQSKLAGEQALLESGLEKYYIVRTSWLYGPSGKNFVETILRLAAEKEELGVVNDQVGSPTYTADLADAVFALLESPEFSSASARRRPYGIYHFANEDRCSWYGFAKEIVALAMQGGIPLRIKKILPIGTDDYPLPAPRPVFSVLSKEKYCHATGETVPSWQEGLARYFKLK